MLQRLSGPDGTDLGRYCCGTCSCALWRHLAAGGLNRAEERLAAGVRHLRSRRDGEGRWRGFPFFYALLALSEMDLPAAQAEMRYAVPVCEQYVRRAASTGNRNARRRHALAQRILEAAE
jgi:hypothetical protein